jgi:hypothetical protein
MITAARRDALDRVRCYPVVVQRRLWFGVAMICAFGSIYAGLFGLRTVQYVLIGLAVLVLILGLGSPSPPDARRPDAQGGDDTAPPA